MIEMIEMIEMIWVPLAGIALRGGEWGGGPEGRRDSDIWDLGVCDPGVGYGICLWFRKICTEHNPCFVGPPLFGTIGFEISRVVWNLMDSRVCRIRVSPMVCPSRAFL